MLADRPAAQPAAAPQRPPAAADGRPVQHRQRHRRRPAGAARHRRRAGVPRPLPPRVADHPPGRRRRSPGCSRCSTRCRCSCPASSWCSSSGSAPGTPSPGTITAGELVAFYGYSAFLMIPLRTATEYANKVIRARVAAAPGLPGARARPRRHRARRRRPPSPAAGSDLYDVRTGLRVRAGPLTAIVADQPDESAALADRLGLCARPVDDDVTPRRRAAHRAAAAPRCAAGSWSPTPAPRCSPAGCGDRLDVDRPRRRRAARSTRRRADDILEALPDGLDAVVDRARPQLLRRPAAAAGAGPGAGGRPRDPGAGRADLGRRRPHRGPDRARGCATTAPAGPPWSPPAAR